MSALDTNIDDGNQSIDLDDLDHDDGLVTVVSQLADEVEDLREHTARQSRALAETRQGLNDVEQAVEAVEQADTEDATVGSAPT